MLHGGIPRVKTVFVQASASRSEAFYQRGK
jgi:hypothetical protein